MIRRKADRMLVVGPVTLKNVTEVLQEGLAEIRGGASIIDLSEVSDVDSSLLAATFAWIREAHVLKKSVIVAGLPKGLQTLAQLYGVEELLPSSLGSRQQ